VDPTEFKARYNLRPDQLNLVIVSRLVESLKGEGLTRLIEAIASVGSQNSVRLIIVGGGDFRPALENQASAVNKMLNRDAIVFTGPMVDPRVAYAAADVVIGMGSSAMRGCAFAKPVIVVGERGFARLLSTESAAFLQDYVMYGVGNGDNTELESILSQLTLLSRAELNELGDFSRDFVIQNFDRYMLTEKLNQFLSYFLTNQSSLFEDIIDGIRTVIVVIGGALLPHSVRARIRDRWRKATH